MRQLEIFFNLTIKNGPWGGSNQFLINLTNFLKNKGHKIIFDLKKKKEIDLIFIVSNSYHQYKKRIKPILKYKQKFPDVKVIHRINDCDKRKNQLKINKIANTTVFVSNWLAQYFLNKGFKKKYYVIHNGCNQKLFYPLKNKVLNNKEIKIVTHHWSNNWLKGFDIYNQLDRKLKELKNIKFFFIGNYFPGYVPRNIKLIKPLYGIELGNVLRECDIYLTASRWEPGPNHIVEGACCGLPILYHKDGGGINEVCRDFGIKYSDIDTLLIALDQMIKLYYKYKEKIPYAFLSSDRCCKEYYKLIKDLFKLGN
ncbi:MAG: glycosyltransferase [Promethearchaeota archaeon]